MLTGTTQLNHVGIVVQDLDASIAWYVEHLGFKRLYLYDFPGVRAAFIGRDGFRIELFQTEGAVVMEQARERPETNLKIGGLNHFAIEVGDLDEALKTLEAAGVKVVSPAREVPGSGGERFAFIRDNEHMLIELFQSAQ